MISNKQRTALVAVTVLVLAVAGPILADMLQAHQAQAPTLGLAPTLVAGTLVGLAGTPLVD